MHPFVAVAGSDGDAGLRNLKSAARLDLQGAVTAMYTLCANGPLVPADGVAIITAVLTGKTIGAGVFFLLAGQHFRHVNLAGDTGHPNERHGIS